MKVSMIVLAIALTACGKESQTIQSQPAAASQPEITKADLDALRETIKQSEAANSAETEKLRKALAEAEAMNSAEAEKLRKALADAEAANSLETEKLRKALADAEAASSIEAESLRKTLADMEAFNKAKNEELQKALENKLDGSLESKWAYQDNLGSFVNYSGNTYSITIQKTMIGPDKKPLRTISRNHKYTTPSTPSGYAYQTGIADIKTQEWSDIYQVWCDVKTERTILWSDPALNQTWTTLFSFAECESIIGANQK
jgi:chemotaxis protein histidine kinase CheA